MENPEISFVIPVLNEESWIIPCLEAIVSQEQLPSHEIIVVDNGSRDRTCALVQERFPGVKIIREERRGLLSAREAGFRAARGSVLACIDADTRIPKQWTKRVLAAFARSPKIVAVSGPYDYREFSGFRHFLAKVFWYGLVPPAHATLHFLRLGAIGNGGNMAIRKDALEAIGGFDTSVIFFGEDTNTVRRLRAVGSVGFLLDAEAVGSARRFLRDGFFRTFFRYLTAFFREIFLRKKRRPRKI